MTKFLLAFIACSFLAQPVLVSATLQFLTTGPDACTPAKIAAIKVAMGEASKLADAAITALANPEVTKSQSFIDFLGAGNSPAAISAKNYQRFKTKVAEATGEVAAISTAADDITFVCPPHEDQVKAGTAADSALKCKGALSALASRTAPNRVRVCPLFFAKQTITLGDGTKRDITPETLANAAKFHLSGTKYGSAPAMTIFHEFQHLAVVVGAPFLDDIVSTVAPPSGPLTSSTRAYSVDQCKALSPADKLKNAQNPTWFAMDVFADPKRGLPCGTPPASPKPAPKPIVRRAKVTSPKVPAPKAPAPKAPAPKVPAAAAPKKVAPVAAAPKKVAPVAAAPPKAPTPPKVPAPAAAKPKPNPLGAGSAPSGPRLARPARLSTTTPTPVPTKGAGNGAKIAPGGANAATPGKVSAPVCKVLLRSQIEPMTPDGDFGR